ncbi:hypothetical protein HNV12_25530 [Methanococcoides sp. SA1]|nr:hypothetical protein [Methanococcoides sp. SA1]
MSEESKLPSVDAKFPVSRADSGMVLADTCIDDIRLSVNKFGAVQKPA